MDTNRLFFPPLLTQTHAFPLCDIPLCVERGGERRESFTVSGGECFSNSIHKDLLRFQSCQKHYRVLIYPIAASDAGLLLN